MSLQLGGLFDIHFDWNIPHKAHRVGKSVDIENIVKKDSTGTFTVKDKQITGTYHVGDPDWIKRFSKLMNRHGWTFFDEHQTTPEGASIFPHFDWSGN